MDKNLLEKSFVIRSEKRERKRNLLLLIFFLCVALFAKSKVLCISCLRYLTRNKHIQSLICDTTFKVSLILAAYNSIVLAISKIFKTKIQVTEEEYALLGVQGKDSSIDINDSQAEQQPKEKLNPILNDEKQTQIAEGFKSFQDNWDESFNLPKGVSRLNISPGTTKRIANLADIIDNSFSFNFPFHQTQSLPNFVSKSFSNAGKFFHSKNQSDNSDKPSNIRSYIQGYFTPEECKPKGTVFDKLDSIDDFKLTNDQKMKSLLKLRKWISKSIIENVDAEIKIVNEYFKDNGLYEYLIGKCSCSSLAKFFAHSGASIKRLSNLPNLISFLEITSKQEYLVNRIHELAQDSSLIKYNHAGGSNTKNFKWNQSFPTDSEIIMHFFLMYMDIHYPDSLVNINKSFTSKYFNSSNPSKMKKDEFSIYKEMLNVNYYSLVIGGKHIKIERNNDNVFLVILYLIIFAKYCLEGYIGSLDLGKSGINILSVVE